MALKFKLHFLNLPIKKISLESIKELNEDTGAKRINFASSHKHALSKSDVGGKIRLPFKDSIAPFIEAKLGSETVLFPSKFDNSVWRGISSDDEYDNFKDFIEENNEIVFLRDNLDLSICLSMNFDDEGQHTQIGELEYQAKFNENQDAESELVDICKVWFESSPYYKLADYICSVPCTNKNDISLPKRIINSLSGFDFEDISDQIYWKSKTKKVKDAGSMEEKLVILEESDLRIDKDLSGKTIILMDDLYMSGLSLQYVAMKLKEAGAERVFGLCLVKSRSNTTR